MKKRFFICFFAYALAVLMISGCSNTADTAADSAVEATTESADDSASNEDDLKEEIDYERQKQLVGNWRSTDNESINFGKNNSFTATDKDAGSYSGQYSVVASDDGLMAVAFAVEDDDASTYRAKFLDGGNTLVLTGENGEQTQFSKSTAADITTMEETQ